LGACETGVCRTTSAGLIVVAWITSVIRVILA
jgi:hypothetical protein